MNSQKSPTKRALIVSLLCTAIIATSAWAMPSVSGNVISWPNDGWYQVENRTTGEIVCQGGRQCTVETGRYWVTQHRPDGSGSGLLVEVGDASEVDVSQESFANQIVTEDDMITWTLPGWYQVQSASSFETVCEGGDSCRVPSPGLYVVINHNLGLRTQVILGQDVGGGEIVVDGQTISWPNDGWYQIQDASNFATVCEGGTSCEVSPGTYIAINHSTGQRWEQLMVNATGPGPGPVEPILPPSTEIIVVANTILLPANGWYQVQNKADFSSICEGVRECTVSAGVYTVINHTLGSRQEVIVGTSVTGDNSIELLNQAIEVFLFGAYDQRIFTGYNTDALTLLAVNQDGGSGSGTYGCANGGSAELLRIDRRDTTRVDNWTYDNCLIGVETRNGGVERTTLPGDRFIYDYENYQTSIHPEGQMTVDGHLSGDSLPLTAFAQNFFRTDRNPLDYQFVFSGGALRVLDADTFYTRVHPYERFGFMQDQRLEGTFTLFPPFSNDGFDVTSDMFGETVGEQTVDILLQAGAMRITSHSDGSYVELDPNTGDLSTALVSISSNNGEAPIETIYRWTDFPFYNILLN